MIAAARHRAETMSVPVAFAVGDASALSYEDATFDVCHAERLLMHVPNPDKVLAEMVRVTRPGGRIGVFDFDWDTMIIDSPDKETTRTIVRTFSDTIRQGWIGRQLPRLFRNHGLKDVSVDAVPVFVHYSFAELLIGGHCTRLQTDGVVSPARMQQWWEDLRQADERGDFLLGFTAFVVAGAKGRPDFGAAA
jgi:ubiquinone/menaquinone biosynthesis C-methylase UbiE